MSDPDSDGGHEDVRRQIQEHHDADDEVEDKETFMKPKHGNKRKKDKIMVEISTQTRNDQSTVTIEVDKLSSQMVHNGKKFSSSASSCENVGEMILENENTGKIHEDYQSLKEQKRSLELYIESFKEDSITKVHNEKSNALERENLRQIVRLQEIERELRSQLEEWEKKYSILHEKNRILSEERCELEEAENDSRLQAQR